MEALWVHDDTVMDIEPGSRTIAVGWDAVKKFIDGNFLVFAELKNVRADGPHVQIKGDLARSMGIAMVTYKLKNGTAASETCSCPTSSKSMTELAARLAIRRAGSEVAPDAPKQRSAREVRGRLARLNPDSNGHAHVSACSQKPADRSESAQQNTCRPCEKSA